MREIEEVWKPIEGYEYMVSNLGRVKSMDRWVTYSNGVEHLHKGKIMRLIKERNGYLRVCLRKNNHNKIHSVHRLVANAFLSNPNNLPEVNHINEDKTDNRVDNLEWMSSKDNVRYSQAKSVNQYTLDGGFIKRWDCINELYYQFGYNIGHIIECCQGKARTAYGFLWKYAD